MKYGNRRRTQNGNEDLVMVALAFLIGYIQNETGPQEYEYQNEIVVVDKKYQCPKHCAIKHNHSVYFDNESSGMIIDKNQLGKKYKKKKNRKKN